MTTTNDKRIEKLMASKDCVLIHLVDLGTMGKKLLMEDKKNARMDEIVCVKININIDGKIHATTVTSKIEGEFAVIWGKGDKVILIIDNLKIYCGYKDSAVKLIMAVLKEDHMIFLAYDSVTMESPAIIYASGAKKVANYLGLFNKMAELKFCEGIPAVYNSEDIKANDAKEATDDGEE